MNSHRSSIPVFLISALILCLLGDVPEARSHAQSDAGTESPSQDSSETAQAPQVAWQIRLGARVGGLTSQIPRLDRVVLVPDLATWLDEIQRWGARGTWPVLIEDDRFTPIFVRRFAPRQLVRRVSVTNALSDSPETLKALAHRIQSSFWSPPSATDDDRPIAELYRDLGWRPPGIVATDFSDPAWPAALALSMLRGQLLVDLPGEFGPPDGALDGSGFKRLNRTVNGFFESSGWSWKTLGDDLDALTLCRSLPVRVNIALPAAQRPNLSSLKTDRETPPVALTDLLCRNADGSRYAVCGWIFGSRIRSIYMAMCALFIDRDSVALVDGYDRRRGGTAYALSHAVEVLEPLSYETALFAEGPEASRTNWLPVMSGGVPADVLFVNSSGRSSFMDMTSGTRLRASDLPVLNHPLALYLIHSFSLFAPETPTTIGGRWLDRGVYAYVGSCNEPLLGAFRPASHMIRQISLFVPFIVASRLFEGEFSKPWRLVTIGDPLMLLEQPSKRPLNVLKNTFEVDEADSDVRADLVKRLRDEEPLTPDMLRDLHLLGQDDLAVGLWERRGDDVTPELARAILPVLFHKRDTSSFRDAFRRAGEPDGEPREMLWTLHGGRSSNLRSAADLSLFERNLRSTLMAQDLETLLPSIVRVRGTGSERAAIVSAMNRQPGQADMNQLKALLEKHPR